jgi:hypothetical protein
VNRFAQTAFVVCTLVALAGGCDRPAPTQPVVAPVVIAPPTQTTLPTAPAPQPKPELSVERLAGKTFIYNHSLVDGNLEGGSVVLKADGKLTGADDASRWRLDDGVLVFTDSNDAVKTRFDKPYTGKAGLFFLGHRTSDNKYHTLIELPPTQ